MDTSYIISGVQIWNHDQINDHCHVLISNGIVEKISKSPIDVKYKQIEASGLVLIPAGVDPQVHLRVPGQEAKETAQSGLHAAIKGGYGAVLNMPNTKPVIDNTDVCRQAMTEITPAEDATGVKVLLSAAITKNQMGREPSNYRELHDWGITAFTDDGVGVTSDDIMRKVFAASSDLGCPVLQHAETLRHGGVLAPGPIQQKLNLAPYPSSAETDMVARDLKLLQEFPAARYHILHVSSRDTIKLVEEAKKKGLKATCEVSPHHLWFSAEDIDEAKTSFKMNPPLRSKEDRGALREALADGRIDFVATDHAPHEEALKTTKFNTAAYGTIGLETALPVLLSLCQEGVLTRERLVETYSTAPARFLSLDESYGHIKEGCTFRAVLVNPDEKHVVNDEYFAGQSRNSCFTGSELHGKIHYLFLGQHCHNFS